MNSKWSEKKNCAVEIAITPEAAAFLNFGNSPFILNEGESKDAHHTKKKGVIQRGNLKPEDIGGVDADDLESVGDVSNAKTVFCKGEESDDEEYDSNEDDGVSRLSDDEEFDVDDDDDEKTINQDFLNDSDEDDMDVQEDDDHDSAFSTKVDLDDLKKGGRRVRRDSDANYLRRIQELEERKKAAEEKLKAEQMAAEQKAQDRMKEMEALFDENMKTVLRRLKVKEEEMDAMMKKMSSSNEASPEAVRKGTQEGANSPQDSADGATAGVK
jgi:hypothetical protein